MNNSENAPENAPHKNKSKEQTQTRTAHTRGPEVVDHTDATQTAVSVKDQLPANYRQQSQKSQSKKKKLSWKNMPWEFLILLSPIFMLIVLLVTDPTAHHLFLEQFDESGAKRLNVLDSVLKIRKDPEVLVQRAWANHSKDTAAELSDLEEARQLGSNSGPITWQMASARANAVGVDKETIGLLRESARQSVKHFQAFPVDVTVDATTFCRSIYGLIACGEFKEAENLLKTPPHTFYGKGERAFFGALLKREAGDTGGATTDLTESETKMHANYYNEPPCFQVLMALDAHEGKNASDLLEYFNNYRYRSYDWFVDYASAWTAFENGDLKLAHQKAIKTITSFNGEQAGIVGLNGLAAAHLLEANIFAKEHRMKQASVEFAQYTELKNKGCTGKLLIPMPYRKWIHASHPGSV